MTYAISDLHGCLDKWQAMLKQIDLKENDMLFVLGDIIDRGPDPIPLLFDMSALMFIRSWAIMNVLCFCASESSRWIQTSTICRSGWMPGHCPPCGCG